MNKIICIALSAVLFALSFPAEAQQPAKIPRIGFLSNRVSPTPVTPDLIADAFRQGLRNLGYIEGKNILVEYRYAEGKEEYAPSSRGRAFTIKSRCHRFRNVTRRSVRPNRPPRRFRLSL